MSYRVIRVSMDYRVAVVVSPEDTDPREPTTGTYHLHHYNHWVDGMDFFWEVPWSKAIGFLSGIADGLGFGEKPEQSFESFEKLEKWLRGAQGQFFQKSLLEVYGQRSGDEFLDFEEDLREVETESNAKAHITCINEVVLREKHNLEIAKRLYEALAQSPAATLSASLKSIVDAYLTS